MAIQTRKVQDNTIDVTAHAVDGRQRGHASQYTNDPHTMQQESDQDFSRPYTGPTGLGGVRGSTQYESFTDKPDSKDCYPDTVIMFHHSPRGVRFAIQGSTRNAIIILVILIMLVSRPGVVELLLNIVKSVANIQ
jgi:hypothetical protein